MFSFDFLQCAVVILLLYVIGEFISTKTKAFVPSVFVVAVLFLLGFWSGIIPVDIIDVSGFSAIGISAMLAIVVHMGTMLSPRELIANWKTVVISLSSLAGLVALLLLVGSAVFDWNTVVVSIPPLAGGMTAAIIMQGGAAERGFEMLSVLAIVVYVVQGFVGYPLTTLVLKREAKRLMKKFPGDGTVCLEGKNGVGVKAGTETKAGAGAKAKANANANAGDQAPVRKRLIPPIPAKYRSVYLSLLVVFVTVWISSRLELLTGNAVSRYVFCLVLGVIFCAVGLLEKNCLDDTKGYGVFVTTAMSMVFAGLSKATPEMFLEILGPLIGILIIGVAGLFLFSIAAGKVFHYSWEMSFAVALNALYGFPPNMIITSEVINSMTDDAQMKEYLTDHIMPKMLIGGFTSVTVTSTLLAGIFINMIR